MDAGSLSDVIRSAENLFVGTFLDFTLRLGVGLVVVMINEYYSKLFDAS